MKFCKKGSMKFSYTPDLPGMKSDKVLKQSELLVEDMAIEK